MKRRLRILPALFSGVIVVVLAGFLILSFFADAGIKIAIESGGTHALNVGVSLDDADLSITGGRINLNNLIINNPPGYEHKYLLELDQTYVKVNTKSLLSNIINIEEIKLDGVQVFLEQRGVSGNNLQDILEQLPSKQDPTDKSEGKKLHVDNLEISNIQVNIKLLPVPGRIDTIPLKLGTIRLSEIGNDNNLDIIALSRIILLAIAEGIAKQGTDVIPDMMLDSLVTQLNNAGALSDVLFKTGIEIGGQITGTGQNAGKEIIQGVENVGKGISEGLGGLLQTEEQE